MLPKQQSPANNNKYPELAQRYNMYLHLSVESYGFIQ